MTPLAIIAGWNRAPSSLVKIASVTGWRVRTFASSRLRMASRAQGTPSAPAARPALRVVEARDDLEAAENAELAVVAAPGRHRVDVGAHHHGGEARVSGPVTEDVAHLVDGDGEARLA